jgi:hypothetical protein
MNYTVSPGFFGGDRTISLGGTTSPICIGRAWEPRDIGGPVTYKPLPISTLLHLHHNSSSFFGVLPYDVMAHLCDYCQYCFEIKNWW